MERLVKYRCGLVAQVWTLAAALTILLPSIARGDQATHEFTLASTTLIVGSLEYHEVSRRVAHLDLTVTAQSAAFAREPVLGENGVRRGWLRCGMPGEKPMAFIWDTGQGRLYLDLNRNEDLTDDPDGVFTAAARGESRYQTFAEVRLILPTDAGSFPMLLDLTLTAFGSVRVRGDLRSFHSGQVTFDDLEWHLGVVARSGSELLSLAGTSLLLRPWVERDQAFEVRGDATDAFPFSSDLFFRGRGYRVSGSFDFEVSPPVCRLKFIEQPVTPGQLEVRGQHIHRLILRDGPWMVVLDEPAGTIPVPAGSYAAHMVQLRHGDARAYPQVWPADRGIQRQTVIEPGQPIELVVAGH